MSADDETVLFRLSASADVVAAALQMTRHPVLRGASFMTQARMRHPRYRNFLAPWRNDVAAGFRTCRA